MSSSTASRPLKNVVVVGGSYVGQMVAEELLKTLNNEEHRVVVVDRNSHFGHLFTYPRFAVYPGHEHKAFLPFQPMLPAPHAIVQAEAVGLKLDGEGRRVLLEREVKLPGEEGRKGEIEFEALVLATGTKLSKPGTLDPEKADAVAYLQGVQAKLKDAKDIVIIGGGAVGVQMATDLAILYPPSTSNKTITVVQSRRLMPRFHPKLHDLVAKRFEELGVKCVTGVRARVPERGYEALNAAGGGEVELEDGRRIKADYVIHALGQSPSSALLASSLPSAIAPNRFVRVKPSLLVDPADETESQRVDARVWAVGDIADSGAPKAARPAMQQAEIVAKDVAKRLAGEPESSFATYTPPPGAIRLSLGLSSSIGFTNPPSHTVRDEVTGEEEMVWEGEPEWEWMEGGTADMNIEAVWEKRLPGFINGDARRYFL